MNKLESILQNYIAKDNGQTITDHNNDLDNILAQLYHIHNINNNTYKKLKKVNLLHDVGKVTEQNQHNIKNNGRSITIRHEYHSASIKDLEDDERLAIITHHKPLEKALSICDNEYYLIEQKQLYDKLGIDFEDIQQWVKKMNRGMHKNKLLKSIDSILLKGYLNLCDHLASAGIKELDVGLDTVKQYKIPKGGDYNSIQKEVFILDQQKDIMIVAATGFGKSATSLYWSDKIQNENKSKRIYYILPYTASINSLYKDFSSRDMSTGMLHSKAEYFLTKIIDDDNTDIKALYQSYQKGVKQINICTIYQLLKASFSCKRYEMLLAQLKNSIFIVDEIHCFQIEELTYILEMLKWLKENFGIYICIMSASIPTCLQNLIKEKLNIHTTITPDKKELLIRHKIHRVRKNIIDDIKTIKKELDNGKQVLICVNSVKLAQKLYDMFSEEYQTKMVHGRFNNRDREKAEQGLRDSQLLIGTQSIEVSLDISYDVMFTEIAPFDALLQRFGRINRRGEKGLSNIYIYDDTSNVYDKTIIEKTDNVVTKIIKHDEGIVLEEKTISYLDQVYENIDMNTYEKYAKAFNSIISKLKVGVYNNSATDDICGNDNMSVLPDCLYNEYKTYIYNRGYLEAGSLLVNINSKRLIWDKDKFYYDQDLKIHITSYDYQETRGLDFDKTSCVSFI